MTKKDVNATHNNRWMIIVVVTYCKKKIKAVLELQANDDPSPSSCLPASCGSQNESKMYKLQAVAIKRPSYAEEKRK